MPAEIKWEGYSNRETWAVCLSLNNTDWMYKTSQALLKEAKRQAKTTWANSGVTEEEETKRLYAAGLQKYIR